MSINSNFVGVDPSLFRVSSYCSGSDEDQVRENSPSSNGPLDCSTGACVGEAVAGDTVFFGDMDGGQLREGTEPLAFSLAAVRIFLDGVRNDGFPRPQA